MSSSSNTFLFDSNWVSVMKTLFSVLVRVVVWRVSLAIGYLKIWHSILYQNVIAVALIPELVFHIWSQDNLLNLDNLLSVTDQLHFIPVEVVTGDKGSFTYWAFFWTNPGLLINKSFFSVEGGGTCNGAVLKSWVIAIHQVWKDHHLIPLLLLFEPDNYLCNCVSST